MQVNNCRNNRQKKYSGYLAAIIDYLQQNSCPNCWTDKKRAAGKPAALFKGNYLNLFNN